MDDLWKSCIGLYVGQLNAEERNSFDAAVQRGEAVQWYEGPASMFGLGKVRAVEQAATPNLCRYCDDPLPAPLNVCRECFERGDDWFHDSDMESR